MAPPLFDRGLRRQHRNRAARSGQVPFLCERAFSDILERVSSEPQEFASALLVGCPDPGWPARLREAASKVRVLDPGPLYAATQGLPFEDEDRFDPVPGSFHLIVAVGTLDTVEDLPETLLRMRLALAPGGLFLAAVAGAGSLPRLRAAMLAADEAQGRGAAAHLHPALDPQACGTLLAGAGFVQPVVDIDHVELGYGDLLDLVDDLRTHASTNAMLNRPHAAFGKIGLSAARASFRRAGGPRSYEKVNILHLRGRAPA